MHIVETPKDCSHLVLFMTADQVASGFAEYVRSEQARWVWRVELVIEGGMK
jgi:hypothetical protein